VGEGRAAVEQQAVLAGRRGAGADELAVEPDGVHEVDGVSVALREQLARLVDLVRGRLERHPLDPVGGRVLLEGLDPAGGELGKHGRRLGPQY